MTGEKITLQDWMQYFQHENELMMNNLGSCLTPRMISYGALFVASLIFVFQTEFFSIFSLLGILGITFASLGLGLLINYNYGILKKIELYRKIQREILTGKIKDEEGIKRRLGIIK